MGLVAICRSCLYYTYKFCHSDPCQCVLLVGVPAVVCSTLMAAHCTAVLRHDAVGQETLLNLLLRNYLHYNLYDQVQGNRDV